MPLGKHDRRAELSDQNDPAPLRIVGQHDGGIGTVQHLPRHGPAVRHLDRQPEKLPPAFIEGFDLLDPVACHAALFPVPLFSNLGDNPPNAQGIPPSRLKRGATVKDNQDHRRILHRHRLMPMWPPFSVIR